MRGRPVAKGSGGGREKVYVYALTFRCGFVVDCLFDLDLGLRHECSSSMNECACTRD